MAFLLPLLSAVSFVWFELMKVLCAVLVYVWVPLCLEDTGSLKDPQPLALTHIPPPHLHISLSLEGKGFHAGIPFRNEHTRVSFSTHHLLWVSLLVTIAYKHVLLWWKQKGGSYGCNSLLIRESIESIFMATKVSLLWTYVQREQEPSTEGGTWQFRHGFSHAQAVAPASQLLLSVPSTPSSEMGLWGEWVAWDGRSQAMAPISWELTMCSKVLGSWQNFMSTSFMPITIRRLNIFRGMDIF